YHLTVEIASTYESMLLILPAEHLPCADDDPQRLLQRLLLLATGLSPRQLTTSKRGPKTSLTSAGYVSGSIARSHVSTRRVLKEAAERR
ncbi:IS4 family transposase, partial [Luteimonas sp. XNQY3]|nr:IS4 family transposase [Luteimonas sp. XNQY3]